MGMALSSCGRISSFQDSHIYFNLLEWRMSYISIFTWKNASPFFSLPDSVYVYLHTTHSSCVLKVLNLVYLVEALLPPADFESLLKKTTTSRSTFLVSHSIAFFCHREYDEFPALQGMRDSSIFAILYFQGTGDTLLGP